MEDRDAEMAVVGMGCHFPGGEGLEKFWKVLAEGRTCVEDIPAERFDTGSWYDADVSKPGKTQTTKAALIEGFNEFDHAFFGITEAEADVMDPQQKLLLQCSYRALEDAGVSLESISGSRTGVYIGLMNRDYEMIRNNVPEGITHYNSSGTAMSVAANRLSFIFNLTGPSFAIDSACSSSLVALHTACQAIKQGDCEMALCGGVNCIIEPRVFVALSKAKMISPEGTSKPFSIRADGYGRGEGCGVILIKPLKKALTDSDRIWGIISKSAVNQDGHSVSPMTKPSVTQQEELLRRIYSQTDIANVQYIEAHGTGTPVGDLTEAASISNVIAKARTDSETLWIGSLKGNIGHTESAAGVAGVIKVLLMMKHKTIVPSVLGPEGNACVNVKELNLKIPSQTVCWEGSAQTVRAAGVNSFGFGGTNAHVLLKEHIQSVVSTKSELNIFILSAASEKSLIMSITDTYQKLSCRPNFDLHSISYTSACRRSHFKHKYRKAFPSSSLVCLKQSLKSALDTKLEAVKSDSQVVFVFCGNGVSYRGMCRQLMSKVAVFREKVRAVEEAFRVHKDIQVSRWLAGEYDDCSFYQPNMSQPLLFAVQVGIATVLKHWGVKPRAMLGHSVGEVAAAHCSGLLSLEDAVKVLHHRSSLQSTVVGGKMLVVSNVTVERVLEMLPPFCGKVSVAAFNSPHSCTLSGEADAVDILRKRLMLQYASENLFLHVLDVPAAYHSHMMDPILEDIEKHIGILKANNSECDIFSTVTGKICADGDFISGTYWAKNIREPVLFEKALRQAFQNKNAFLVEIGPRKALERYICETLGDGTKVLTSVQPDRDCDTITSTTAKLFELGLNINWKNFYCGREALPTVLPVYQFNNLKKDVNYETLRNGAESLAFSPNGFKSELKQDKYEFTYELSSETLPYLWEHKNNDLCIVPGSFYVALACSLVMAKLQPRKPLCLLHLSVTFENVLSLKSKSMQLKLTLQQSERETIFTIQSSHVTLASGECRYIAQQPLLEEATICQNVIYRRCNLVWTRQEIYTVLSQAGYEYGPLFRLLDNVHFGNEFKEAITTFQVPDEVKNSLHEYSIHPVVLDYFMQMTVVVAMAQLTTKHCFPSQIENVAISGSMREKMVMYLRATQESKNFLDVCGCFSSIEGDVLIELKGVRISFLDPSSDVEQLFFHNETIALEDMKDVQDSKIKAIVFEDQLGIAKRLRPYVCSESVIVESKKKLEVDEVQNLVLCTLNNNKDLNNILFIWGVDDLSHLSSKMMLDTLVTCCEVFRNIVLAVKSCRHPCVIRVITYRSTENTVDHFSPGFVLSGMTRSCVAEIAGISFQLIDLASISSEDIRALVFAMCKYKQHELRISAGQVSATRIAQTVEKDLDFCDRELPFSHSKDFVLQTADSYSMTSLSLSPNDHENLVEGNNVEIQLTNMCVHSSDYFPVSSSHFSYGRTMYWNKHVTQHHNVLALDFSGTVMSVGRDVKNLSVGDHIVACYPVTCSSKVVIPEGVCFASELFPFLRETPCVSYFVLAWEILHRLLSDVKRPNKMLAIVSPNLASTFMKVIALTAIRSGWNVSSRPCFTEELTHFDAVVFLPPIDLSTLVNYDISCIMKHIVCVGSSHMSSLVFPSNVASKNVHIQVQNLDLASVLQRANVQAQNQSISQWLQSLGLSAESFPFRGKQLGSQQSESYFMVTNVQQVVLNHRRPDCPISDIPLCPEPKQLFKAKCVYIVTGGLTGLGRETVTFIARNGGGCIAILSRSIPSNEMQAELNLLQKRYNVLIVHYQCDVSESMQVVKAVSNIQNRFHSFPIKGVFHSAAVLQDALIESLDKSLFTKVLKPKISGAINLHFATLQSKLDYFVCYSSISSFIGNASQCNYAAANSFLDTFCHFRRNLGLTGQSINWGPLNLGLLLNKEHFQKFLEIKGMLTMDVLEVHGALRKCLLMNKPQQAICRFNFRNLMTHVLSQNESLRERLSAVVELALRDELHKELKVQHSSSTEERIKMIVKEILNMNTDELDVNSSLSALGIDSMLAMTLQNKIYQETGINVPLVVILDPNSSLITLISFVLNSR